MHAKYKNLKFTDDDPKVKPIIKNGILQSARKFKYFLNVNLSFVFFKVWLILIS